MNWAVVWQKERVEWWSTIINGTTFLLTGIVLKRAQKNQHKFRSVYQRCSVKKGVLKNFAKFTGKHLRQRMPATLLKKRLWHRRFPVNLANFLRTPFLQNTSGRLLLQTFCIKLFLNYTGSDEYLGPFQWWSFFAKIVNGYFAKKLYHRC